LNAGAGVGRLGDRFRARGDVVRVMSNFFLRRNSKIRGPFASNVVREMAEQGKLRADDELSRSEDGPWKPANSFRRLRSIIPDRATDDSGIIPLKSSTAEEAEWLVLEKGKKKQGPIPISELRNYVELPAVRIRRIDGSEWVAPDNLATVYPELVAAKLVSAQRQTRQPTIDIPEDDEPTDVDEEPWDSESSVADSIWSIIGGTVGLALVAGVVFVIYRFGSTLIAIFGSDSTEMLGFDLTLHGFFYGMAVLGGAMIASVFTWVGFFVMLIEKDSDNQTGTGCLAFLLFGGGFLFIVGLCGGGIF